MTTKQELGFGAVPIISIVAVVAVLGFVGFRLLTPQSNKPATNNVTANNQTSSASSQLGNTNQTAASPQGKVVASEDGKVSFTLPASWHTVDMLSAESRKTCGYGEPDPCTLSATFSPSSMTNESYWSVVSFKSTLNPRDWAEQYPLGSPTDTWKDQSDAKINSYDSFYVAIDNDSYRDLNYVIAHNGTIVYFHFREVVKGGSAGTPRNSSQYTPDFNAIVKSVKIQ